MCIWLKVLHYVKQHKYGYYNRPKPLESCKIFDPMPHLANLGMRCIVKVSDGKSMSGSEVPISVVLKWATTIEW